MSRKPVQNAWDVDPEKSGYGKHPYRSIDPTTINPEDYARNLLGDQQHYGDVREYNCAGNEKHPENTIHFDWLCRVGTTFETDAPGYEGAWKVVEVPTTKNRRIYIKVQRVSGGDEVVVPADVFGVVEDESHLYKQVKCRVLDRGKVARETRG